jgi:hypothetical protein
MAERKKKLTRAEMRTEARKSIAKQVKPWPMGLDLNVSRIRTLAAGEWSFETLYDQVRQFAGGSVTREVFQEFLKAKQIALRSRPQGGSKTAY